MKMIKVTQAKYIEGFILEIKFSDGNTKLVDFKNELWGEIFEPLKDINYFKKFSLNPFTIEWANGADFSPEFLYGCNESKAETEMIPRK
ncbi:MAG: DUF2442 domain-containing protein [Bacteroidia bacterium]|nr:DUF2442 domain-containing protein [Bacteroidia bacterium]